MKRVLGAVIVLAVLALAGTVSFRVWEASGPEPIAAPALPPPPVGVGHNGLSDQERGPFYHLSEGGELYPLDWLLALEVQTGERDGRPEMRPFLDNIERYGFLSDAKSADNPYGLPVGVSYARSQISGIEMIGLNCTACHVGQISYQGHALRVDGAGNMAVINQFLQDMVIETQHTIENPRRLVRFWRRVDEVRRARRDASARDAGEPVQPDETLVARGLRMLTRNRGLLQARLNVLRAVPTLKNSIAISTPEGFGRLDAFGIGRDELFGSLAGNSLPADAPVSLPHIWGLEYTGWLQWGANTNSVMERNIGQALGVGALFIPGDHKVVQDRYKSTVRLANLHQMEQLAYKLTPPEWPEFMPPIDQARAARGSTLFTTYCAGCHETYGTDGVMRNYQLFALAEVGTDPMTALNYERVVRLADGQVLPFPFAALALVKAIKEKQYQELGMTQAQIDEWERRDIRRGPQWTPTFRAPLLDSEKWPDTKGRRVYRAKTLVGIWATAPFLHNGSVPTIYDLLKPAAERPVTFKLGQREYDPVKLGVQLDPAKYAVTPGLQQTEFDTRLLGNWNTGHEWRFYPALTDDMRLAIIEFLKTYTKELPQTPSGATAP